MPSKREHRQSVLYFGNDWFADNRTSSHHIARQLARRFQVYYIECPGMRAPRASGRDLKRIFAKALRFAKGVQDAEPNLKVRTLLQIPLHRFPLIRFLNRVLILATIKWLVLREGIRRPFTWFTVPHLAPIAGHIDSRLSIYYCTDAFSTFPEVDRATIAVMDETMGRTSDLVFVTSETLLPAKRLLNPHSHVSRHGVDFEHFARAQAPETKIPSELSEMAPPILGFVGLIEAWIDLDLVSELARQRPHWQFVMIGRLAIPEASVPRLPNIHFLGKQPYEKIPAFGKAFSATLIPFRATDTTFHVNPLKLREYLAMGKPVVSTSTPEIDRYGDAIEIAKTPQEFLVKLDRIFAAPPTPEKYMARVAQESWEARVDWIVSVVEKRLLEKEGSDEGRLRPLSSAART